MRMGLVFGKILRSWWRALSEDYCVLRWRRVFLGGTGYFLGLVLSGEGL